MPCNVFFDKYESDPLYSVAEKYFCSQHETFAKFMKKLHVPAVTVLRKSSKSYFICDTDTELSNITNAIFEPGKYYIWTNRYMCY